MPHTPLQLTSYSLIVAGLIGVALFAYTKMHHIDNNNMRMTSSALMILGVLGIVVLYYTIRTTEGFSSVQDFQMIGNNLTGFFSRPSFSSNLDPNNLNMRFDPNMTGGYIRGSPNTSAHALASDNKAAHPMSEHAKENFEYIDGDGSKNEQSQYKGVNTDFASIVDEVEQQHQKTASYQSKFNSSLDNKNKALDYTLPSELLPVPDMRQSLVKDPSDPSNFIYDRTVFAPLKSRNRNYADRVRGDLDIAPLNNGWFNVAALPSVDLAKGYLGNSTDIGEQQEIQDIVYSRGRNQSNPDDDEKLKSFSAAKTRDMMMPSLKYATHPELAHGSLKSTPWGAVRSFEM